MVKTCELKPHGFYNGKRGLLIRQSCHLLFHAFDAQGRHRTLNRRLDGEKSAIQLVSVKAPLVSLAHDLVS